MYKTFLLNALELLCKDKLTKCNTTPNNKMKVELNGPTN